MRALFFLLALVSPNTGIPGRYTTAVCPVDVLIAYEDSVADESVLPSPETQMAKSSTFEDSLRSVVLAQRRYYLSGDYHDYDRALRSAQQLLIHHANCGYVYYLVGKVKAVVPRAYTGATAMKSRGFREENRQIEGLADLYSALRVDPTLERAMRLIAQTAMQTRTLAVMQHATDSLKRSLGQAPSARTMAYFIALTQRTNDTAFTAVARRGDTWPDPLWRYERNIAAMNAEIPVSDSAFFSALKEPDAEMLRFVEADMEYLFTSREREQWSRLRPAEIASFVRVFWQDRAAAAGVSLMERINEHYRRLKYARLHYPHWYRIEQRGQNEITMDTLRYRRDIDDRGLIYVKFGPPDEVAALGGSIDAGMWIYRRFENPLRFSFAGLPYPGFELTAPPIRCNDNLLIDIASYDPRAGSILSQCASARGDQNRMRAVGLNIQALQARMRNELRSAIKHDDGRPRFSRSLPFYFDLYSFKGSEGTDVLAVALVPAGTVGAGQFTLAFDVADTVHHSASRNSRSITIDSASAASAAFTRVYLPVTVHPAREGLYRISLRSDTDRASGTVYGGPLEIPDYAGSSVLVSGLALVEAHASSAAYNRAGRLLSIVPTNEFRSGVFGLYYEVYNLQKGEEYKTEVTITPIDRSVADKLRGILHNRADLTIGFNAVADETKTLRQMQEIQTDLPSGHYKVEIRILTKDGKPVGTSAKSLTIPDRVSR
jgi:hypothetical protein